MKKKILVTSLIIIGLAVVAGGFYIASQSQNNADLTQTDTEHKEIKQNNNQKDNQENEVKELKAENIDTSNWKEYCNKEYGFCVKYPESVELFENKNGIRLHRDCSDFKDEGFSTRIACDIHSDVYFGITKKNISEFIEGYKSDCDETGQCLSFITSQDDYALDGVVGKELKGVTAEGGSNPSYIFVSNNGKNYIISYIQVLDKTFDAIIKSFKFIN